MASPIVERAGSIAAQGAADQAVSLLETAVDQRDADAAMQLAVWYLSGEFIGRDFDRAKYWLRRAVIIGHVDGALTEIALTANGYGGRFTSDWTKSLKLLTHAATSDPVAEQHLKLLGLMDLTDEGQPNNRFNSRLLCESPKVIYLEKLLTPEECAHVATVSADLLEPAPILDPTSGKPMTHAVRTSDGGAIGPAREDMVVRAINCRIAAVSETNASQGEPLTVLRYRPSQQYRAHLDTIAGANNQRIRTVLVYLNQGFSGGETKFPLLGLSITPQGGDAIIFDTILANGSPDKRTLHTGEPVQVGVKWIATRWIRAAPYDPWNPS